MGNTCCPGVQDSRRANEAHRYRGWRQPLRLLYIPWAETHTGALVRLLEAAGDVEFTPLRLLDMIPGQPGVSRLDIIHLAASQPAEFDRLLRALLKSMHEPVHALLVTVDWASGLRHTTLKFRKAGFPTVLVPHESVFAREELYYRDPFSGVDVPQADMALLWGRLQEEIFLRRGLAPGRMKVVGSPKLDFARSYRSTISREEFYARWGLRSDKPVILFVAQSLDLQYDEQAAQKGQSRALAECLELCQRRGYQLVLRMPTGRGLQILEPEVLASIQSAEFAATDGGNRGFEVGTFLATPHDALYHADVAVSINSTMLLEASLMERPALSLGHVECEQLWHLKGGLPLVSGLTELDSGLRFALKKNRSLLTEDGWRWIRWAFSPGEFDGASARRIIDYIAGRWKVMQAPSIVAEE